MQKKVIVPVSIAAVGFIAGGIMLGSLSASAHGGKHFDKGNRGEVVAEVLGISVDELREVKDSGVTFEEYVVENGYESIDDFQVALDEALAEGWAEEGLSEEEIEEKLAFMAERREFRETMAEIREDLLGMSREELIAAKEDGQSREDLILNAGYESVQEYKEAVEAAMEEAGIEKPDRPFKKKGFGHGGEKRGF